MKDLDRTTESAGRFSIVAAALPYRADRVDGMQVLLVRTSSGRWMLPKGRIEAGEKPWDAAVREAWEEAGVIGVISETPCGAFEHQTQDKAQHILVFPLRVLELALAWPEHGLRERGWFSADTLPTGIATALAALLVSFFEQA